MLLPLLLLASTPFDAFLNPDIPPADGFSLPIVEVERGLGFGEDFELGVHPGQDFKTVGPVMAAARGRVLHAGKHAEPWGGVVVIEHVFYDNHELRRVRSQYAHLSSVNVGASEMVERGQKIGEVKERLHFEIRSDISLAPTYWPSGDGKNARWVRKHYASPARFVAEHETLFVPQQEKALVMIDHRTHAFALYEKGVLKREAEIGFGQSAGRKRRQGDLKTPKGMYFVVKKYRGKFDQPYGEYYGGHWIKINYPNAHDAAFGLKTDLIGPGAAKRIAAAWRARKLTPQGTRLGGGIGFHGWAGPWSWEETGYLSWGCVVFHNEDIKKLYSQIPMGAMVIIR